MLCSGCQGELRTVGFKGIAMYECSRCKARWIEGDEFRVIKKSTDHEVAWLDMDPYLKSPAPAPGAPSKGRICPRCLIRMVPFNYIKSNASVDKCPECKGAWLSAGDFAEVMRQSSGWIMKRMPQKTMILCYAVSIVLFALVTAGIIFFKKNVGSGETAAPVPGAYNPARELADMKWKNEMAEDMLFKNR